MAKLNAGCLSLLHRPLRSPASMRAGTRCHRSPKDATKTVRPALGKVQNSGDCASWDSRMRGLRGARWGLWELPVVRAPQPQHSPLELLPSPLGPLLRRDQGLRGRGYAARSSRAFLVSLQQADPSHLRFPLWLCVRDTSLSVPWLDGVLP